MQAFADGIPVLVACIQKLHHVAPGQLPGFSLGPLQKGRVSPDNGEIRLADGNGFLGVFEHLVGQSQFFGGSGDLGCLGHQCMHQRLQGAPHHQPGHQGKQRNDGDADDDIVCDLSVYLRDLGIHVNFPVVIAQGSHERQYRGTVRVSQFEGAGLFVARQALAGGQALAGREDLRHLSDGVQLYPAGARVIENADV